MEVVSGDNWTTGAGALSRAKLLSNHHHQQTNIQFFSTGRCPSCHPTNSVKALKGKYHIPWTCLPQTHLGVFQLCLWPLIAPGYFGEVCHMPLISPLMPVYPVREIILYSIFRVNAYLRITYLQWFLTRIQQRAWLAVSSCCRCSYSAKHKPHRPD